MNIENELYRTSDLYLGALIKSKDIRLIRVIRQGNRSIFCFENTENLGALIDHFYDGTELVSAQKLIDSIKNLKAMTYNIK